MKNKTSRRNFITGLASLATIPCAFGMEAYEDDNIKRTIVELVLTHLKKHISKATQGYYYLKRNNGVIKDAHWGFNMIDCLHLETDLYKDTGFLVDSGKLSELRFLVITPVVGMIGVICGFRKNADSDAEYIRLGMTSVGELKDFAKDWSSKTYTDIEGMVNGNFRKWIDSIKELKFDLDWTEKKCCSEIKNSYVPISNRQFMEGVSKKLIVKPHGNQKGIYDIELEWIYGDMWTGKNDIKVLHETVRI